MSISEIIETLGEGENETEICATAEARYDSSTQKVSVTLDSFARCVFPTGDHDPKREPWLPTPECVTEHLPADETQAFTHDVFQSWVKKVRGTIPRQAPLGTNL